MEPSLGGGPAITAWTIQALMSTYDITLATWAPFDPDVVNRFYGTSIAAGDLQVRVAPAVLRWTLRRTGVRGALLKMAIVVAIARRLAPGVDVLVSCDAEVDLRRRAIQYVNQIGRASCRERV